MLQDAVPRKRVTQDTPDFRGWDESNPFGIDESSSEEEEEVYSTRQDTTTAANEESRSNFQLLIPNITPEPVALRHIDSHSQPSHARSRKTIGNVGDPRNIVTGSGDVNPPRHEIYLTELSTPKKYPGFFTSFSAGLLQSRSIHRDQLPLEPRN